MRIAFLTPEYVSATRTDGGLANYLRKISLDLVRRGCEVWVFVISRRDAVWYDDHVIVCEVRCCNRLLDLVSKLPLVRMIIPAYSQITASRKLARKFWSVHSKTPFNIIQASSYKAPGFALLNNGKVPLVCRASSYTPSVRAAYGRKLNPGEYIIDWMETCQVRDADACIAPSRFVAGLYKQAAGCEPQVLRTPVDGEQIEHDTSYFLKNRPSGRYLLFFGTLSRIKGVDLLAGILPGIFDNHSDLSMVFIGRDDGLPDSTKVFELISSACSNYADRLHFHQALVKTKLYSFIEHAEVILMPSRLDNCPNACLEAQMFGIPVIGTYDSSLDEMIEDGITGFLARNSDTESIRDAIERCLLLTVEEKMQMRQNIISHVDSIVKEDRTGQLLAFYEDTVHRFRDMHV